MWRKYTHTVILNEYLFVTWHKNTHIVILNLSQCASTGGGSGGNTTLLNLSPELIQLVDQRSACVILVAVDGPATVAGVCNSDVLCVFLCASMFCIDRYVCQQVCVVVLFCVSFYMIMGCIDCNMCLQVPVSNPKKCHFLHFFGHIEIHRNLKTSQTVSRKR